MPRLREQRYKHADGSSSVNCYNLSITRRAAQEAGFTPQDMLIVHASAGKITVTLAKEAENEG